MNFLVMDVLGFDLSFLIAISVGLTLAGIAALVLYFVIIKPRIEQPLPDETPLGHVTMWIPKGFGLKEGNCTTARRTLEREFTRLVENQTDKDVKAKLESAQKIFDFFHPIAQKVGRETFIYFFDKNPQDQQFWDSDPSQVGASIIHGVQDAMSVGKYAGFQILGLHLDPETKSFSEDEKKLMSVALDIVKYVRDAAKNTEQNFQLKEHVKFLEDSLDQSYRDMAQVRSKFDRSNSALSQKSLTQPEEVHLKGTFTEKVKQWFKPIQLLTALAGYLLAPYILIWTGLRLEYPVAVYFAAFTTVVGFFSIPIAKKIFGRWL
jgi:hypothetical protein